MMHWQLGLGVLCGGILAGSFVGWMIWHDRKHRKRVEERAQARRARVSTFGDLSWTDDWQRLERAVDQSARVDSAENRGPLLPPEDGA